MTSQRQIKQVETIDYKGTPLSAILYPSQVDPAKGVLLYFHGGGLIFGESDDLPQAYTDALAEAGYDLVSLDYPLAPEMGLADIVEAARQQVEWYLKGGHETLGLESGEDYYLFGRSAGAFLALRTASVIEGKPQGILSLYGYYNLLDATFSVPNRHYLQFSPVSEAMAKRLVQDQPLTAAPIATRYPLYLYGRQTGRWMDLLSTDRETLRDLSLTREDLAQLPPTFIAAGDQDPDVPSRQSKQMANFIPETQVHIVQTDQHDFDRTAIEDLGLPLYRDMIAWLDDQTHN